VFSYSDVCISDNDPVPTLSAGFTTGGTFTATGGLPVNSITGIINLSSSTAGTYTVTYTVLADTSLAVCRLAGTSTASIVIHPLPIVGISSSIPIFLGGSTTLFASGGVNYLWTPSTALSCPTCDTTIASPIETHIYCVKVTDTFGCADSSCVEVSVEIPCATNRDMTVPNAFTPNGDNYNDELCLFGWNACITNFEINIFDRWGEKVFESRDPGFCWDGVYKGKPLDSAVFVYFIKATFVSSGAAATDPKNVFEKTKKGNISLVR
jgi:gliding motility-associated-like protein